MHPFPLSPGTVVGCRRSGRRKDCRLAGTLTIGFRAVACTVEDIDPRGCRVTLAAPVPLHGREVRLEVPKLAARFRVDVAWVRGREAGLRLAVERTDLPLPLRAQTSLRPKGGTRPLTTR